MRSTADPILRWRRRLVAASAVGAAATAACAWWAMRPVAVPPPAVATARGDVGAARAAPTETGPGPLDLAAFDVALWNPEPPAVAESSPPPPPEPPAAPRYELLGIVRGADGQLSAALYDPESDRIRLVRDGESLGDGPAGAPVRVVRVTADLVELAEGRRVRRLRMRDEDELRLPSPAAAEAVP